ncbi:electron transport protein [Cytobacillus sp. FJAT-54145]|uniref:Electron transport protein n=1 Tax=Cytobacillus spartinae TaxID=3299023 RepID=A0ABW6KCA7_9BACI
MKKRIIASSIISILLIGGYFLIKNISLEYAFIPEDDKTLNQEISISKIQSLGSEEETGTRTQIELGKEKFFSETFGNEVFFSDILGMFDGAFTLGNIAKAILKLKGEGTSNLQVEAATDFEAGDRKIKKGELIDTGLDVAKGSLTPLGVKVVFDEGRLKAGISCAVCHASVDSRGNVIEGIPNSDLDVGLALAMGTNTASYFSHTELANLKLFIKDADRKIETSEGELAVLPDPVELEKFTDSEFVKWPRGSNDTTIDLKNNPVQWPDTFTLGDHPYGWSGQGQAGSFKGLTAAINNAHAQNMDALSATEISKAVLDIDKEIYLGTALQNAANPKFRYKPNLDEKPTEFFAKVDPTPGVPGVNKLIPAPTYPKISFMTSVGMLSSTPGFHVWEEKNAMSAYMNSLQPVKTGLEVDKEKYKKGRRVFEAAGCISCHAGQYLTSNKLIKSEEIGTNPSRAKAFKKTEEFFAEPSLYSEDTPVPLPKDPKIEKVPLTEEEREQLKLGWAHGTSNGGYKTISLYGLYWSAPYLHDGGISVGENMELGLPNTLMKKIKPDPYNSLKAVMDSRLRKRVVEANLASKSMISSHISGDGHEFWVDESTGFTEDEQDAIIYYLLRLTDK